MTEEPTVLVVDVGGSQVKMRASGEQEIRRQPSGPAFTPVEMVEVALGAVAGWRWDVVTVGIPAPVRDHRVLREPYNLGDGWVGFDFEAAFGVPTKVMNDAAMQALGSYEGGVMLFLGFGTGLGSALVVNGNVQPMELAHLPFKKRTFEDYVGDRARKKYGRARWQELVHEAIECLRDALEPETIVLGGGNADKLDELPPDTRLGDNANAFVGGFRAWSRLDPD